MTVTTSTAIPLADAAMIATIGGTGQAANSLPSEMFDHGSHGLPTTPAGAFSDTRNGDGSLHTGRYNSQAFVGSGTSQLGLDGAQNSVPIADSDHGNVGTA